MLGLTLTPNPTGAQRKKVVVVLDPTHHAVCIHHVVSKFPLNGNWNLQENSALPISIP